MPYDKYFSYFPTVPYELFDGSTKHKVVTDILKRVRATLEARTDKTIYSTYRVRDGETPEHIAYNYYGSAHYHWVVLLMNDIRDPQWSWPLDQDSFERFIVNKYGSMVNAINITHHYETNELRATSNSDLYSIGDVVLPAGIVANSTFQYEYTDITNGVAGQTRTYTSAVAVSEVTAYDYEVKQNEKNADIVLLRKGLLQEFVDTFESLLVQKR